MARLQATATDPRHIGPILAVERAKLEKGIDARLPGRVLKRGDQYLLDVVPMIIVPGKRGTAVCVEFRPRDPAATRRMAAQVGKRIGRKTPGRFSLSLSIPALGNSFAQRVSRARRKVAGVASLRIAVRVGNADVTSEPILASIHVRAVQVSTGGGLSRGVRRLSCISLFDCHSHWFLLSIFFRPALPLTRCCGPCTTGGCKCADVADEWLLAHYCQDWGWCICR